jgi:hypothetical protein
MGNIKGRSEKFPEWWPENLSSISFPIFGSDDRSTGIGSRDVCPDSGLARPSYGPARALLDQHTALNGSGTGWELHEFRHLALTHLGEAGASPLILMAKSRHKSGRICGATSSLPRTPSRSSQPCSPLGPAADFPCFAQPRSRFWVLGVPWLDPFLS